MITGNEQAMPYLHGHIEWLSEPGLTIRQYFAAMCLQGILSNPALYEIFAKSDEDINEAHKLYGIVAVEHADALIAELNKDK